jgi:dihydrofolate synthase/folylpolyglutamate synthase
VVGISFDKKADEIAALLARSFDTVICTTARHKGADAADIAASVRKANAAAEVQIAATIEDAVSISQALAASRKQRIYVAGGLFLAIEYATIAGGGRAQDLDFF